MVIGYLLYGGDKHSISVTLIGFLMVSYVAIFAVVLPILRPEVDLRRSFQNPDNLQTLLFSPDSLGGYVFNQLDPDWNEYGGAPYVTDDDGSIGIQTPFPVPFFGVEYDSVWVGTNGSVSFGAEIDTDLAYSQGESFYDNVPSAMVMYSDFLLGGSDARIFVDESPDRLLITWFNISNYDQHESTYNLQTVLYRDGRVQFNYGDISSFPLMMFTGISPGGPAQTIVFQDGTIGAPGQALFEFQDTRAAYRAYVHPLILPATAAGAIGLFVVLLLGILFYRAGILVPLDRVLVGLRSVERGDLDKTVVISERNELGSLADYFNQMTTSLREYRDKMEDLVSKRTADLDRTISDLKSTQAQLVEQEKLASLGSLTAGIAHEIKNPLNFVNNFAEVGSELFAELKEAVAKGDNESVNSILGELEQNSEQIAKHGKRADSIVRSMMQHAKGGSSEMEAIQLNVFLEEYANLAWHGMRARDHGFQADLIRDFDADVGSIRAMPQELGRVILNLLNNAFDAIRDTENPIVTISTKALASEIEITVADNGPGIPEEIREKVLEPFFTTKATGEGTGLGLSLSYDIITNGHGGQMLVKESETGGAQFVIRLPA
jgi:signal transduction histidine kinase